MWDLSSVAHLESPALAEWSSSFWDAPGVLIGWALVSSTSLQYYVFVKSSCLHWALAHVCFLLCEPFKPGFYETNKQKFFKIKSLCVKGEGHRKDTVERSVDNV